MRPKWNEDNHTSSILELDLVCNKAQKFEFGQFYS